MWSENTVLRFDSNGSSSVMISDTGTIEIETGTIDEQCDKIPTFIKMDIEGAEYEALLGARKTISEHKPKLAISVYHKPEDIIELPKLILDLNPGYKLWLRHYSFGENETVLYGL